MKIIIETIPHRKQRYETVGDWFYDKKGNLIIRVSLMKDWKKEVCVAVHELVEVLLCKSQGISQAQVDRFDMVYESVRNENDLTEPGDDSQAPYKRQHCLATSVERLMVAELGLDWKDYEDCINAL